MSIPEEMIMQHMDMLLNSSKPGAELQYLHVISAGKNAARGPLGMPGKSALEAMICAIVPDTPTPQEVPAWIRKACAGIYAEHINEGKTIMFAATGQEVWVAPVRNERERRLRAEGRLDEHPEAIEATIVYGAARDGRRWRGMRYLTGPNAGEKVAVDTLVGRIQRSETAGIVAAPVILKMVGLAYR